MFPMLHLVYPHTPTPPPAPPPPAVSVILAYFVTSDGSSNWLLGLQLVATYCLIGFVFLMEVQPSPPGGGGGSGSGGPPAVLAS